MSDGNARLRIVLIGNYGQDGQQSMLRFGDTLRRELLLRDLEVEMWSPVVFLGRGGSASGVGKWLRYVDKFVLFPTRLRQRLSQGGRLAERTVAHICDHSNSLYARTLKSLGLPLVVTCHDLGAVRGALGEDTECAVSRTGQILQKWITTGLGLADLIACDSTATRQDVERLVRTPEGIAPPTRTVLLGQNTPYRRMNAEMADQRLCKFHWYRCGMRFVLNVGSSLPRKNREGVLRIFARAKDRWDGVLVFAGQGLPDSCRRLIRVLGLDGRVFEVPSPSDELLEALYNRAHALLFPSKFEGFGWPVIEAQACGCPVLCSDAGSLAEVAADSAFVRPWQAEHEFAEELLRLEEDAVHREHSVARGSANLSRFETSRMINDYLAIYEELTAPVTAARTPARSDTGTV